MNKILIIGCPGAGKSSLARHIQQKLTLPIYYLDLLWMKADGSTYLEAEFDEKLASILAQPRWIMDGNYLRTLPQRVTASDTIIFLDYPLELCLASAKARIGTNRPDFPYVEESFDPEFEQWIKDFPRNQLPTIEEILANIRPNQKLYHFKNRTEADNFCESLTGE